MDIQISIGNFFKFLPVELQKIKYSHALNFTKGAAQGECQG